ncbi:hypothetical protein V1511DRAFT_511378 [Dipodascopsis uninucleata]
MTWFGTIRRNTQGSTIMSPETSMSDLLTVDNISSMTVSTDDSITTNDHIILQDRNENLTNAYQKREKANLAELDIDGVGRAIYSAMASSNNRDGSSIGKNTSRVPQGIGIQDVEIIGSSPLATIQELVSSGTCILDAIVYSSIPLSDTENRSKIRYTQTSVSTRDENTMQDDAIEALNFIALFIFVCGRPPLRGCGSQDLVPGMIRSLGFSLSAESYVQRASSFDLSLLANHDWIKPIISKFDINLRWYLRDRGAIAGYRYAWPLVLLFYRNVPTKTLMSQDSRARKAAAVIAEFVEQGPVWDAHPATRSEAFFRLTRSFSKNCANILVQLCSKTQQEKFVKAGLIPNLPSYDERYMEWTTWTDDSFVQFKDYVW